MSMGYDEAFDTFARRTVTSWPESAYWLASDIEDLYRLRLKFPASWDESRKETFIVNHADAAATDLSTTFDDLVDTVVDAYGRANYRLPDRETASEMIERDRMAALDEFKLRIDTDLADEIEAAEFAD